MIIAPDAIRSLFVIMYFPEHTRADSRTHIRMYTYMYTGDTCITQSRDHVCTSSCFEHVCVYVCD